MVKFGAPPIIFIFRNMMAVLMNASGAGILSRNFGELSIQGICNYNA